MFNFNTLVFARIAFLLSLAFFILKDITLILDHHFTLIFTQALDLPALKMSPYSAQLGFVAVLLAFTALSDLVPLMEQNHSFFEGMVPARTLVYFLLVGYAYISDNIFFNNNLVFMYLFTEALLNMSIFSALREEKNERVKKQIQMMELAEELELEALDAQEDEQSQ